MSERSASNFRRGAYTASHVALMSWLNRQGIEFKSEQPFFNGQFRELGHGEMVEKAYVVDILITDARYPKCIIEVEGEGSNSADNSRRDQWFAKRGYSILHISNADAKKHPEQVLKFLEGKKR